MPDFRLKIVSGFTVERWDDSKIRHRGAASHLYYRVTPPALPAVASVVLHAVVAGVEAPLDAALGGRLFAASRISFSGAFPFAIDLTAGQSSVITLRFAANMLGHQELVVRRPGGGAVVVSFDVES